MMVHRVVRLGLAFTLVTAVTAVQADGGGVWSQYDVDRDGYLNPDEFAQMHSGRPVRPEFSALWRFEQVDGNGDGVIDQGEMVRTLQEQARLKGLSR